MITWIQIVLQKHHKVVFSVLLVAITIAFVFTIGQIPFFGDRHRYEADVKDFYGYDLSNRDTLNQLYFYASYDAMLMGTQPTEAFIYRQAFLRHVAKNLGIRQANEKELINYIHSSPIFAGKDGKFDEKAWKQFVDMRVASGRMTEEALTQILAENAMLSNVEKLLGGPGFVFKGDVQSRYEISTGTWNFNLATVSYKDFKPEIKVSPEKLEAYYKQNASVFKVGDGVVLETVFLPIKDFASKINSPSEPELNSYYVSNISKYSETKDGTPETLPFAKVKDRVKADFLTDSAMHKAMTKAEEVALKIYNSKVKMASPELKAILAEAKLITKKSKPMRTTDSVMDKSLPSSVVTAGFKLDQQNFYADPIADKDGVWLVFLAEQLASYQPKLADVKTAVEKAYVVSEKQRLFAEYCKKIDAAFVAGVKSGKKFDAIAKANNVDVEEVKNFSLMNPASASSSVKMAYQVLSSELPKLKLGAISKVQVVGENGYIIELVSFKKPEVDLKRLAEIEKNYSQAMSSMVIQSILSQAIAQGEEIQK